MIDNKKNGTVYGELKENIRKGSKLSIISAYFTMYAYYELRKELDKIEEMRFIYTTPTFIKSEHEQVREYFINKNNASFFSSDYGFINYSIHIY